MSQQSFVSGWAMRFAVVTMLAALALPIAGCGKKAPLEPPPGGENSPYPRAHPTS